MKEFLLQLLVVAYASVGIISVVAYWPTIKDLHYKKPSANITSYILWTVTTGISFLYSLFVLSDFLFRLVSGLNFGACLVVLIFSFGLNRSKGKELKEIID